MASIKRNFSYLSVHHIYNRGVLKKEIFHSEWDYKKFVGKIIKYRRKYPTEILAFCLMPNHFHFLLKEMGETSAYIPRFMQQLQSSYAIYYATKYGHSGRLFQGTYKSKIIQDQKHYLDTCNYIINNPVKSNLANNSSEWKFKYLKGNL